MKNINKITNILFSISALGITANAGTLQESLENGKISGEIRSTSMFSSYTDGPAGIVNNSKAGGVALQLNYETSDFNNFKISVGGQIGTDLGIRDKSNPNPNTGENEPRATVRGADFYKANISYANANTEVIYGKQQIQFTPLIMNSSLQPLVDSFHALTVINKDIPDTEIGIYVIKDWYSRDHATYSVRRGSDEDFNATGGRAGTVHYKKPVYSIYVKNTSIEGLTIDGQYLNSSSDIVNRDMPNPTTGAYTTYVGRAYYNLPISYPVTLSTMYAGATFEKTGEKDTDTYGFRIDSEIANIGIGFAYTSISDDNDYPGSIGHAASFFLFNNLVFGDDLAAGLDITSVILTPKFDIFGVSSYVAFSKYSQSAEGIKNSSLGYTSTSNFDGATELNIDLKYEFTNGIAKGTSVEWEFGAIDFDLPVGQDDKILISRIYLNYKF